jgi:sec-independent protein translocase protein TatB
MFDVGFAELFLLALIGLLVLGPERLPAVARTLGGMVRKARASWNSLRRTIESELAEADISAPIKQAGAELKRIGKDLTDIQGFTAENRENRKGEADKAKTEGSVADNSRSDTETETPAAEDPLVESQDRNDISD